MVWGKLLQMLVDKVGELDTPPPKKKKRKRAPEPEPVDEDGDEEPADGDAEDEPAPRDQLKVRWLPEDDNPFCIPVVDLAPFALAMRSTSKDPQMAANVSSYATDDGTELATQQPPVGSVVACALRFRIDRVLVDGALFQPTAMEDKWAIYLREGRILCVRSWTRRVQVSAAVTIDGSVATIGPITGVFADDEPAAMTVRQLEFLLRSHALGEMRPAPLPPEIEESSDLGEVTATMFSRWGRRALFGSLEEPSPSSPVQPLRTESLMHIAVARGQRSVVESYIKQGIPLDILARDGLGLPHWALGSADPGMLEFLIEQGVPVDVRSTEGATPLMNAVQERNLAHVQLLLARRADPNAVDLRGFTALHRAAEMGSVDLAKLLLAHDATHDPVAQGQTPLALAKARRHNSVIALLSSAAGPAR